MCSEMIVKRIGGLIFVYVVLFFFVLVFVFVGLMEVQCEDVDVVI